MARNPKPLRRVYRALCAAKWTYTPERHRGFRSARGAIRSFNKAHHQAALQAWNRQLIKEIAINLDIPVGWVQ
jgi:hypothetical protein